ncbi:DegT/DnrJ/EryC1/StrS family aminotransferase [Chloroflexota bacterium]
MEIPTTRPFFSEQEIEEISDGVRSILRSGRLVLDNYTQTFEESFREYCGVKHAIAVSSCTAALEIALRYFDVKGKEVIIPTNTFIASSNAVIYSGGIPILADIKADTLCIDPLDLAKRITPETKGVIIVHIAGLPCPEIEEIREICREKCLFLIEDAAHAHGATINDQKTGSLGDAGCFSFYPTKVMTTSTGGMITTDDADLAEYAISLRHHGVGQKLRNVAVGDNLTIEHLGNDWLMDEISALLGIHKLRNLEANVRRRNEIAQMYAQGLMNFEEGVKLFTVPPHITHSYYKYPILLSRNIDKQEFVIRMKTDCGISLGSAYDPPCHLQPVYQKMFGFRSGMFPTAEVTLTKVVCLPMYQQMTNQEVNYVLQSIRSILPGCQMNRLGEITQPLARE